MDTLLQGIPKTAVYLDDVLVQGGDLWECIANVNRVLAKLNEHNVKIQPSKCLWFKDSVEYLGHVICKEGRSPSPTLAEAIVKAPTPKNVKELRSFLGLINFYASFLPSASTLLNPLRMLTEKAATFVWSDVCQAAFVSAKQLLLKSSLLIHYDPTKEIIVHTDASPVGVACVLNHKIVNSDGTTSERPVLFASSSLTPAQQRYSQLDREALAIIFAVTKLRKYLWGRTFTLVTDNQPIRHILSPDKGVPIVSSYRLQHWAAILPAYKYRMEHRKANYLSVLDALSRLPLPINVIEANDYCTPDSLPLNFVSIAEATTKDPILSKVFDFTLQGWPPHLNDPALNTYFKLRFSLSIDKNLLLMSNRVLIPLALQAKVLALLHDGHPGIVRMRLLARSSVWWPSINADIDTYAQNCTPCAAVSFKEIDKCTYPWRKTLAPFHRVHVDFYTFKSVIFFFW